MKRRWISVATTAVALAALTACGGAEEAATKAVDARDFVALGDSYAAGLGAGNYGDSTECVQSKDGGYPHLWAALRTVAAFGAVTDATCAGARINDVRYEQLTALSEKTGWVTLTVGGNDAGWTKSLQTCLLGTDDSCKTSVGTAVTTVQSALPSELDSLYKTIRDRAPNAKVYVLGYPHLVAAPGSSGVSCEALTDARRKALNDGADALDELIKGRVTAAGFTFVDVREAFKGHEACTKEPWIHGIRDNLSESYHPTPEGHKAYAEALFAVTG
ncbi:SGNH/GDSL hydrolase family protein [Actinoplanes philippinensis]|uniref:SGNH/GDSL hydrolase family protein n=1 Tax=Actinoplanes philippinensis TaxID=35752 RepID=UPI0033C47939